MYTLASTYSLSAPPCPQNMPEEQLRSVVRDIAIQEIDPRYLKCNVPATGAISRIKYEDDGVTIKWALIEPDDGYPLPKGNGCHFAWLKGRNDIPNITKGTRVKWDGIQVCPRKEGLQARNLQLA